MSSYLAYNNFLNGGHRFKSDEILLQSKFRMLSAIIAVVIFFASLFGSMQFLGLNNIGDIHGAVNLVYASILVVALILLRRTKEHYTLAMSILLVSSMITFTSALFFVSHDEFRIVWFYLLMFVAYITGGSKAGIWTTMTAIAIILTMHYLSDLFISETALYSALGGLIILSLLTYIYSRRILMYEMTLLHQTRTRSDFNEELEKKVQEQTVRQQELNFALEQTITQKVAEARAQQEMLIIQSRLAAMGEMLSMIAHQWRQPLATMTLMISNAKIEAMIKESDPSEMRTLDEISDTLLQLASTIDDYQTYFDPQKNVECVSFTEVIQRLEYFVSARLDHHGIELMVHDSEKIALTTYANEVVQILINLVNNAIDVLKALPDKKKQIIITAYNGSESVTIRVQDNGGGIPPDILPNIFKPYYSTKPRKGTGLGLYMAQMIMENHLDGSISVENSDEGACFTLELPHHKPAGDVKL
jgi:signal transduction histidine kinase